MQKLTILWLDDMRNPYKYFSKKNGSETFIRNKEYYTTIFNSYDVDFVWVKNFDEFAEFILKNGLPQFISFDHDLGAGLQKGADCARWLVEYCKKKNEKIPQFYIHSANRNGQREINNILNFVNENIFKFKDIVTKILKKCQ